MQYYTGETERRLGDRVLEKDRNNKKRDKNASKLITRHSNLPIISYRHMTICGLFPQQQKNQPILIYKSRFLLFTPVFFF